MWRNAWWACQKRWVSVNIYGLSHPYEALFIGYSSKNETRATCTGCGCRVSVFIFSTVDLSRYFTFQLVESTDPGSHFEFARQFYSHAVNCPGSAYSGRQRISNPRWNSICYSSSSYWRSQTQIERLCDGSAIEQEESQDFHGTRGWSSGLKTSFSCTLHLILGAAPHSSDVLWISGSISVALVVLIRLSRYGFSRTVWTRGCFVLNIWSRKKWRLFVCVYKWYKQSTILLPKAKFGLRDTGAQYAGSE